MEEENRFDRKNFIKKKRFNTKNWGTSSRRRNGVRLLILLRRCKEPNGGWKKSNASQRKRLKEKGRGPSKS